MLELGLYACVFVLIFSAFLGANAFESIPITVSGTANKIIFDGKWTHEFEWKQSSLNTYSYANNTSIVLRSSHQGDFIYIFLDPITDYYLDTMNDYAVVCFDAANNKSPMSNIGDYCFKTSLQGETSTYQGGYSNGTNHFNKIPNPDGFIGVSAVSDINDRYTAVPHPSYEFRVPTNLIGRESVYGFYFLVYDGHSKNTYTYPQNLEFDSDIGISSPDQWGEIYSPDKSLPEFGFPTISLVLTMVLTLLFTVIVRKNPLTRIRNDKIRF
ncbi:MAG: hypothetical protein EPO63_04720 [Candidatus Nitrosotenuis sp.]|nr:MAG: hypothetical protein EPO63_04720 [Candidatus Nitrosotenuis sp.]